MVKRKIRELRKKYLVTFLKNQPPPGDPPPIGDPKPNDPKPNDPPPIRDPPIPPSNAMVRGEKRMYQFRRPLEPLGRRAPSSTEQSSVPPGVCVTITDSIILIP